MKATWYITPLLAILLCYFTNGLHYIAQNLKNKNYIRRLITYSVLGDFVSLDERDEPKRTFKNGAYIPRKHPYDGTADDKLRRHSTMAPDHVCCTVDQWEASAYLSSGDVFIDSNTFYAYINGTGRISFDGKGKKSYVRFNITQYTPLMPTPQHPTMTVIKDYDQVRRLFAYCTV